MLKITGGHSLSGSVSISGSKNAAGPIIWAALLFPSATLHNVPRIADVLGLLEIIQSFGVEVDFTENTLKLRWKSDATDSNMDRDRMKKMRISILLLPALLARFGQAMFPFPGGCNIGKRPIGEHISGLVDLGYALSHDGEMMSLSGSKKTGEIHLYANRMVTATENLVMASVFRKGTTHIHSGAYEPHSIDVVNFFRSVGIEIETRYDHSIIIQGEENIPDHVEYTLIHDYLESGTFVIAGALAAEQYIDIEHACIADLDVFLERIRHAGVHTENLGNDTLRVYRATDLMATDIQTNIFPGLPSDLGSQIGVLLTQCEGNSRFHEVLYEGRFSYLGELEKMKAHVVVMNPHEAMIFGPTPLQWSTVSSWDLRAGASMVLAGLIAEGCTYVTNDAYIDRGYEDLIGKLQKLGAQIETISVNL